MKRLILAAAASAGLLLSMATPAAAALPENCIQRAVDKSEQLLVSIEGELGRNHSRLENAYSSLRAKWTEFAQYFQGAWVKECLDTYPQHRETFNKFLAERATPIMHKVRERLITVCTTYSNEHISAHKTKIDELFAAGRTGEIEGELRRLENLITKKEMVAKCKPLDDEKKAIVDEYIPQTRKKVAMGKATGGTAFAYFRVESAYRQTKEALASKGKTMKPAPDVIAGAGQGASDFRRTIETCTDGVAKLRDAGAGDDYALNNQQHQQPKRMPRGSKWKAPAGPASATLAEAEALCREVANNIDELAEKARAHNDKLHQMQMKAWEKANVKGSGMRRVYNENKKRQPEVENLGSKIVWTYRSYTTGALMHECKEYVFSKGGALKNRRVYACR